MKCKHQDKRFLRRWVPTQAGSLTMGIMAETDICVRCGAWFSLGLARDTLETAIEVRAAEIVADIESFGCRLQGHHIDCEGCGWASFDLDEEPRSDAQWAGWLANAIHSHKGAITSHNTAGCGEGE